MDSKQKQKYICALAAAIALVDGPRDEDYNRGGVELRDYWEVNGIRSPLQMVDMKLKRAKSQVAVWDTAHSGPNKPRPLNREQVEKFSESMLDLINYAAFAVCEAESLYEDRMSLISETSAYHVKETFSGMTLAMRIQEAIQLWKNPAKAR